jgi:hypothetical protein
MAIKTTTFMRQKGSMNQRTSLFPLSCRMRPCIGNMGGISFCRLNKTGQKMISRDLPALQRVFPKKKYQSFSFTGEMR